MGVPRNVSRKSRLPVLDMSAAKVKNLLCGFVHRHSFGTKNSIKMRRPAQAALYWLKMQAARMHV
jgi:hypothetical protein